MVPSSGTRTCSLSNESNRETYAQKQPPHSLRVLNDLGRAHLAVTVDTVDKGDGHLTDGEAKLARAHNHLHLENIALGDRRVH
ncbi:hypothetical protein BC937DRAFT_88477 [Endogone sp. FLAS-F59071]|nr:hypothetical protein BC937DRAFT_88477 [Endogone sp. FLAS-F59071]|eukprot:RUS18664.1 hypothetical protein BC937DRAFT_88477 [Endogone sp. FLAS-F59071]